MSTRSACIILFLAAVFVAAVSQVLLKKAAMRHYESVLREYLNPLVIVAYGFFFLATAVDVIAYREVPLSLGPILEASTSTAVARKKNPYATITRGFRYSRSTLS